MSELGGIDQILLIVIRSVHLLHAFAHNFDDAVFKSLLIYLVDLVEALTWGRTHLP